MCIYIYIINIHSTHTYIMSKTFILDAINRLTALIKMLFVHQVESGQGDLGTLANVVTSLANTNGDTSDSQLEESPSEITRCVTNADNICVCFSQRKEIQKYDICYIGICHLKN